MQAIVSLMVALQLMFQVAAPGPVNTAQLNACCPVLVYHALTADETQLPGDDWTVTADKFRSDLQAIKDMGFTPINSTDLYEVRLGLKELPAHPVWVTFDDGYENNYTIAFPILQELGYKAEIFVVTSLVGSTPEGGQPHFSWEQAQQMENSGLVAISLHGYTHVSMMEQTPTQRAAQISLGFSDIEQHLGQRKVHCYCYPGGDFDAQTLQQLTDLNVEVQMIWQQTLAADCQGYHTVMRSNVTNHTDVRAILRDYLPEQEPVPNA